MPIAKTSVATSGYRSLPTLKTKVCQSRRVVITTKPQTGISGNRRHGSLQFYRLLWSDDPSARITTARLSLSG